MTVLPPRHQAALQAAAQRIKQVAREAAERGVDGLGVSALSSAGAKDRADLLAAQFELNRKLSAFAMAFNESLDEQMLAQFAPRRAGARPIAQTNWESLSLVDDSQVEAQLHADRLGLAIQHSCEWELRELNAYMGSLLDLPHADQERNPLRPSVIGRAMAAAIETVTDRAELHKLLAAELTRGFTAAMPKAYSEVVASLRSAGLQPVSLSVRTSMGPGHDLGRNTSGYDTRAGSLDSGRGGAPAPEPEPLGLPSEHGELHSERARLGADGFASSSGRAGLSSVRGGGSGTLIGEVDAQLMGLIRRLAALNSAADSAAAGGGDSLRGSVFASGSFPPGTVPPSPNLIQAHRDELRQASTGALDHMVIDVVGSLFEQILSDPKVPPQMARQLARLQLPVLRVALGDASFFSSRRHPVRRFVNRIASLAVAFDDLAEGPGKRFLEHVRDLVQDIVAGDFDQMETYEHELSRLEAFIAEQSHQEVQAEHADTTALLESKERQLRLQQRYMQQLQAALQPVEMQPFLRSFLTQVWSQAIVQAAQGEGGENGELARRLKLAGRELVMSVQPKGTPVDRKNFLLTLPRLMKELNEGIALIGWPEPAKKAFFAQLLPAHAESLKGQSLTHLDHNLMVRQLDAILGAPLPSADRGAAAALPVLQDAVDDMRFSADEAQQIGFVAESAVDWDGSVDIELGAEPELSAVDIQLEGLPAAEPAEPTSGASLAEHVELGFAYQMHLEDQWQKVKLSYVSPGRAFFVFTRGRKHQRTISMTSRMLQRMCESGRMRAFENAYLLERATARARKQLAALGGAADQGADAH